ncbi:MAG TPA: hypothetical protein VF934_07995 [Burkholderiales bacterium]
MRRIPVPVAPICIFTVSGFSGLIYESIWSHYIELFLAGRMAGVAQAAAAGQRAVDGIALAGSNHDDRAAPAMSPLLVD